MRKKTLTLALHCETLRQLDPKQLQEAAAGFTTGTALCPTYTCRTCYRCTG
jgi:hypothetical protein